MAERPPEDSSDKQTLAVLLAFLIALSVLIPILYQVDIPAGDDPSGIVSFATLRRISPYSNYVKYLVLALALMLAGALVLTTAAGAGGKAARVFLRVLSLAWGQKVVRVAILTALGCVWLINATYSNLTAPVDTFHEGERLGFLPVFMKSPQPFRDSFLIHGFGVNVLPGLVGQSLASGGNGIAMTRLLGVLPGMAAWIGCFWILWEIARSLAAGEARAKLFLFLGVLFCSLNERSYLLADALEGSGPAPHTRGAFVVLQVAWLLRLLGQCGARVPELGRVAAGAFLLGVSVPAGILYCYDRSVFFSVLFVFGCVMAAWFGRGTATTCLAGGLAGVATGAAFLLWVLGRDQAQAVLSQLEYWGRFGDLVSFQPLMTLRNISSPYFFSFLVIPLAVILYLAASYRRSGSLSQWIRCWYPELVLLATFVVYLRVALGRSDVVHLGWAGMPATLLLCAVVGRRVGAILEREAGWGDWRSWSAARVAALAALALLAGGNLSTLNPVLMIKGLNRYYRNYSTPDTQILRADYVEAVEILKTEVGAAPCFFTLTSEGIWYYLFDRPSCSRFHQVVYSRTPQAQQEVVAALHAARPPVILLANDAPLFAIDGVSPAESSPLVYQQLLRQYRPYRRIGAHWFWKRAKGAEFVTSTAEAGGSVDPVGRGRIRRGESVELKGRATVSGWDRGEQAICIGVGDENRLILAAPLGRAKDPAAWSCIVPGNVLGVGEQRLRVWRYEGERGRLLQLGNDIRLGVDP